MLLGIIFVILFLSILILVHELGHFLAAKKFGLWVEEFGFGLPPRVWGKKIGETIYSINWLPFGGFVKIFGENREDQGATPMTTRIHPNDTNKTQSEISDRSSILPSRSFTSLSIWKRAFTISAGVLMNFLLGWFIISAIFAVGVPQAIVITEVGPDSPAATAGLIPGDKILKFGVGDSTSQILTPNSAEVESPEINSLAESFVEFIRNKEGQKISLEIERNGKILTVSAIPRVNPPAGEGALGIGLVEAGVPKQNFLKALFEGFKTSLQIIRSIVLAIGGLLKGVFLGQEDVLRGVAGPVGIVKITAEAGKMGFIYLLQLLSLISLNLSVINILPFPALDGGRLLFLVIEKIKGSPLPVKFEKYANAIGMAILLLLMTMITIKDIGSIF